MPEITPSMAALSERKGFARTEVDAYIGGAIRTAKALLTHEQWHATTIELESVQHEDGSNNLSLSLFTQGLSEDCLDELDAHLARYAIAHDVGLMMLVVLMVRDVAPQ